MNIQKINAETVHAARAAGVGVLALAIMWAAAIVKHQGISVIVTYWVLSLVLLCVATLARTSTRGGAVAVIALTCLFLAGVDLTLTVVFIVFGPLAEANPFAQALILSGGWPLLAVVKLLLSVGPVLVLLLARSRPITAWGTGVVAAGNAFVGASWVYCLT